MNDEQLRAALQAEYLHLQKVIEDFDGRALTIKAWSITFSLVALVGAFASGHSLVFLVSSVSALLFWFIEGSWKTFQYAYYGRSGDIEEYFRGEKKIDAPFQIGTLWSQRWHSGGSAMLKKILFWPHVALPHVIVAVLGAILYFLSKAGIIRP